MTTTICIHCHIKMLSNPYSTPHPFWCPRCDGHDYKTVSRNGHKRTMAKPPAKYATEYTCPECGGQCEREEWRCSWLCPNCMIMFNDPDPVRSFQPHPHTVIDVGNAEHYWSLATDSVDHMNIEHFTNRATFYAERAMTREWDRRIA